MREWGQAKRWVTTDGVRTLEDLKKVKLNHHQQIGMSNGQSMAHTHTHTHTASLLMN